MQRTKISAIIIEFSDKQTAFNGYYFIKLLSLPSLQYDAGYLPENNY
jgi:hypothetical protein